MRLAARGGQSRVDARLVARAWSGEPAFAVVLAPGGQSLPATGDEGQRSPEEALATLAEEARSPLDSIEQSCDRILDVHLAPLANERIGCIEEIRRAAAQLRALLGHAPECGS
jgi:hypothetical protein